MEAPLEEKDNSPEIAQGESLESFFTHLIKSNQDIPETYLQEFGFDSGEEFRNHLIQEQQYHARMEITKIQENREHVSNIYALEEAFFDANMSEIVYIHPELANAALLGTHSHQILSDIIYTTCRGMDRCIVGNIMAYFQVVDIQQMTADLEPVLEEPVLEESDIEEPVLEESDIEESEIEESEIEEFYYVD